jgi:hypothetical protein
MFMVSYPASLVKLLAGLKGRRPEARCQEALRYLVVTMFIWANSSVVHACGVDRQAAELARQACLWAKVLADAEGMSVADAYKLASQWCLMLFPTQCQNCSDTPAPSNGNRKTLDQGLLPGIAHSLRTTGCNANLCLAVPTFLLLANTFCSAGHSNRASWILQAHTRTPV